MGKPDLSVKVQMTPRQAVMILSSIKDDDHFLPKVMESALRGAETRVRNALMDAGWHYDGKYWVKDDGTP